MLRLALPTGDLRTPVAEALALVGLACDEYAAGSRALRLAMPGADAVIRVFREKDIPIQIALGNYDLGICSLAWLEELQVRYPREDVTLLRPLAFGRRQLVVGTPAGPRAGGGSAGGAVRIVSEYPNLAERFAREVRLAHYVVLPVWGAAEAYPPEDADVAVLSVTDGDALAEAGLRRIGTILDGPAVLLASRRSLAANSLGPMLGRLLHLPSSPPELGGRLREALNGSRPAAAAPRTSVRLAIPDGHAQRHTFSALAAAGLHFEGYEEKTFVRRPNSGIEGLEVKVIRPQDMPQQVAIGNFDLAITGRDWLFDHLAAFPSSPVAEAVDLGLSRYKITAAVSEEVPADALPEALRYWRSRGRNSIRVASEYPNIADHFARAHHLGRYQIVPVNGASEAFVPEDSEILIEGSETGSSFRANRLKPVEHVFESTNCVIAGTRPLEGARGRLVEGLLARLRNAASGG